MAVASDEELAEMLIAVRGIGMWTVHMFSMFSMRRPDVLPVGDLGVQGGVVRWFLSWHDPRTSASPVKLRKDKGAAPEGASKEGSLINKFKNIDVGEDKGRGSRAKSDGSAKAAAPEDGSNPFLENGGGEGSSDGDSAKVQHSEAVAAATVMEDIGGTAGMPSFPEPFTPSIKRTLTKGWEGGSNLPPKLPEGLSVAVLKSRLEGKKVKGSILTASEMEALTEGWKPYRSLGSYYMWALAEQT